MRWRLAISALLFALPLLARAEIEFGLVQTIQLPQNMQQSSFRSWDVQHWMDNESYGWAVVAADTIVYRVSLDRPFEKRSCSIRSICRNRRGRLGLALG